MMGHHNSQYIDNARTIIQNAQGKTLSEKERCLQSIALAKNILIEALSLQTPKEKKWQSQIAAMANNAKVKGLILSITDQCFRSDQSKRIADQMVYLIQKFGIPSALSGSQKLQLKIFQCLGNILPYLFVPPLKRMVRKETSVFILPGESKDLRTQIKERQAQEVRINLNHLGEAILGEGEAKKRLDIYLSDLARPEVEYISVKISTIYSQLNLLAWEEVLKTLSERLKCLYRAAKSHSFTHPDGRVSAKFVNLDMEEYRDLHLTVDAFKRTLEDPEFLEFSAGIVLQSYLPDSFLLQQELTAWAMERIKKGGAPIKIRIVKGANLAMEQVESSLRDWPQAPYPKKELVDANFKRMLKFGAQPEHAEAAHLGIASHNLFDIAYGLLLCSENRVQNFVCFEMLEGMADHIRRVVQQLSQSMLLYCPAASKKEFQNAVAYLVRRFDENTAPENFLRHSFDMTAGSAVWNDQEEMFSKACTLSNQEISSSPRRFQNRFLSQENSISCGEFTNEADTDWALPHNRKWAEKILVDWKERQVDSIPLVIGGKEVFSELGKEGCGEDPSYPGKIRYHHALAQSKNIEEAFQIAQEVGNEWGSLPLFERSHLLKKVAQQLRSHRADLIGSMVADTGKVIAEADVEVSEAVDFVEYYWRNAEEIHRLKDIRWTPKGTVLIAPPWNFPCSISVGGIAAALAAGNCVLFKPAIEAVWVGWEVANCFWNAGVSKSVLQFIPCQDEPIGTQILKDPRLAAVVLTGATETAKLFMKMRPGIDLIAETGGKNAMIISSLSDRDLVIKDLIQSAFGHAGQKCSACSLAICEAEVYDDPHFMEHLRDAAQSLKVGIPWDPATRINPLIRAPNLALKRGLTTLEDGESWLLEPIQDAENPHLWSPGIKLGVKEGGYMHHTELFGPVLGVMRAVDLNHAIRLANGTPYGLTSGLHSLDEREKKIWIDRIEAGNVYINRGITGAIVQRQPFGGCKESSFGPGAKAGGPNYVAQLMHPDQNSLPEDQEEPSAILDPLRDWVEKQLNSEQKSIWKASLGSYSFYWQHYFRHDHDPSLVLGQDNIQRYVPHPQLTVRLQPRDAFLDAARAIAAALICGVDLEISGDAQVLHPFLNAPWCREYPSIRFVEEREEAFLNRIFQKNVKRVRLISSPTHNLEQRFADLGCHYTVAKVLANGRLELLRYLREMSLSIDYHRYGNLGEREGEKRAPLLPSNVDFKESVCCANKKMCCNGD